MADPENTASFAIELEDDTSGAAQAAAQSLGKLRTQIDGDTKALAAMQRAMKNLQGGTVVNIKQFKQLQEGIAAKKQAIAHAQSNFLSLGGTFTATAAKGGGLKGKLDELAEQVKANGAAVRETAAAGKKYGESLETLGKQASALPGPLGGLVSKLEAFRAAVTVGGPVLALAVGFVALGAALGVATLALTKYAIAHADARRAELLHIEGLTTIRNRYGLAAGNAKEMQEAIDKVAASNALGRDKIAAYSDQLYKMGLRGNNLSAALEGVAIKATVQGEAQASMFAGWAAGLARTGGNVQKFADTVKARLGGTAARQMELLSVQAEKQKESFDALFEGINIAPYEKAHKKVSDLLSQNTNSGKALKQILTLVLQPFIDGATSAQPLIKRFFQGMILESQRLIIQFLQVRNWAKRTFLQNDVVKGIDKMNASLIVGKVVLYTIAAGLAFAAGSMIAFAAPVLLAGAAIYALINTAQLFYQLWKEIDWVDLGTSIWKGIVNGLKAGATWVIDAVKGLGEKASSAFKAALGIHSPSKAFTKYGLSIPAGVAVGVRQGSPDAQRAVEDITGGAPNIDNGKGAASSGGGGATSNTNTRSVSLVINELHVHASGDKPKDFALDVRRELENALEGVALELGAPIAGAA